jgi:hypothetical protein
MATTRRALPPLFETPIDLQADTRNAGWYQAVRDHESKREGREHLEAIWNTHGHLLPEAPEPFLSEFRRHFHPRAWELYMLGWLARSGAVIERPPGYAPDLCATHPDFGRFWIECVVATVGTNDNAVWQRTDETVWGGPPDEPLMLRYTSVIATKVAKITEYRDAGVVRPDEPVLIALNVGPIRDADLNDFTMPLAFKVLYGFGHMLQEQLETGEVRTYVVPQPTITNARNAEVSTQIFRDPTGSVVAGLLLTRTDVVSLCYSVTSEPPVLLAHSPNAIVRVPIGVLPVRGELWIGENGDFVHRGRLAQHGRFSRDPGEPSDASG